MAAKPHFSNFKLNHVVRIVDVVRAAVNGVKSFDHRIVKQAMNRPDKVLPRLFSSYD